MLEATRSLSRNDPSFYIAGAAVTLAVYRARQAVKDAIRRKGEKVSSFAACEITAMAKVYLAEHRELMVEARATVERWTLEGVFGKRASGPFVQMLQVMHNPRSSRFQSLRLCRCQVQNDDGWIRTSANGRADA
jgi:hypothetical protein